MLAYIPCMTDRDYGSKVLIASNSMVEDVKKVFGHLLDIDRAETLAECLKAGGEAYAITEALHMKLMLLSDIIVQNYSAKFEQLKKG